MKILFITYILVHLIVSPFLLAQKKELLTGADVLISSQLDLLKQKKIGIVTNHTAVLKNGTHLVDTLHSIKGISIKTLFGPEHGIRGNESAGRRVLNSVDPKTSLPVYSLYGDHIKPTKEMLKGIDLLIYDIQDVGARFYTYISTLYYILQACAENNIPVLILDRPNPIDGRTVEGPVLKDELKSFVGIVPIPIRYAMTVGELATYFAGEEMPGYNLNPYIKVIRMEGWERNSYYEEYDLPWINPSPNIVSFETALVYPGTCLIEGTNISEGRGTLNPFLTIGAPFIKSEDLIAEIKQRELEGFELSPAEFTPVKIPGMSDKAKYINSTCYGLSIKINDREKFRSVNFGIHLFDALIKLYPEDFNFNSFFDKLAGDSNLKEMLTDRLSPEEIIKSWNDDLIVFKEKRKKYLLY
jgi:uncharacterized protein YbbC (DUF1343 family)